MLPERSRISEKVWGIIFKKDKQAVGYNHMVEDRKHLHRGISRHRLMTSGCVGEVPKKCW